MALSIEIDAGVAVATVDHPPANLIEVAHLLATGIHRDRMTRFLEAGGQTREQEIARMQSILDVVLER